MADGGQKFKSRAQRKLKAKSKERTQTTNNQPETKRPFLVGWGGDLRVWVKQQQQQPDDRREEVEETPRKRNSVI